MLHAEWRRLRADHASLCVLAVLALVLMASALSSGLDARAWRARMAGLDADWQRRIDMRVAALPVLPALQPGLPSTAHAADDPKAAAMRTFQIGRNDAPPAVLVPLGGLALDAGGFRMLSPAIRVTVESRHTDARREERLANPLLQGFAVPGFATVVALLVPLALLCLCAAVVQQAREQGVWRLTAVQCPRPAAWLAATLGLRAGAVWLVAALASCTAFGIDPGAGWTAWLCWQLALAAFIAGWTLLCALSAALPVSSASALLLGVGVWLLTTFAVPAALAWHIDRKMPMPSRLASIVQIRDAQQRAEAGAGRLLAEWYESHPSASPASAPSVHTWPVSFLPRYLAQDAEIGPMMQRFDEIRAARYEAAARWAWLSPALRIAMVADELAGSDAPRHARFVGAVNRYEAQWRAIFVPRIMAYRDMTRADLARLPRFSEDIDAGERDKGRLGGAGWRHALALLAAALVLLAPLVALRRRLGTA